MRKFLLAAIFLAVFIPSFAQDGNIVARNPEVIVGRLIRITKPLREMTPADKLIPDVKVRDLNGIIRTGKEFKPYEGAPNFESLFNSDGALQNDYPNNPQANNANRAIVSNFNGIGYQPLNPPDPTMCAGPNHLIQMINGSSGALFKIFNKTGGTVQAQMFLDAITGEGGLGDPIALYDQLADRFFLAEFVNSGETGSEGLAIAVSQSADPTGSWYVYFFSRGTAFPDYPKFAVWPDAYYATTNDFNPSYTGTSVYAFDRAKMLAGDAFATVQRFTIGAASKHFSMSPVGMEGMTLPPAGTGGLLAYMLDDAWTAAADFDSVGMYEFKVDFVTPANTVITTKVSLNTAAFKSDICTATRGRCISQPGSTIALEALQQKVMNQPKYRRFGSYEGIVLSHVADKGSNISGMRWYELRKTGGNWSIYQQSTYAPDNTHRWLPGICYDMNGNIGLAYNVASSATGVFAGARYTGRKECDPLNTMPYSEDVIINGTAANSSNRYGDYNHLVCDPDGVTFWFTCEYNAASTWSTRIASFTLDPCTPPPSCATPTGLAASNITNTSATISWNSVSGALNYDADYKEASSGTWINAATATTNTFANLGSLTQGTVYDYRVRANCSGGSSSYSQSQFTTTSPCNAPANFSSNNITTSSANVTWDAVSGAVSYTVEYKRNVDPTYTVMSPTVSLSQNITGLQPNTLYDARVKTNCSGGSSTYSTTQFTTLAGGCPDILEPNNTISTAKPILVGVSYNALIATASDVDYYSFNNTSSMKKIRVTMNNLPANYDLRLYKPNNNQLVGSSSNTGTTPETIIYNASKNNQVGTYKVQVLGAGGAFNSTQCYTLLVQLSATNFGPEGTPDAEDEGVERTEILKQGGLKLFPVPASQTVNVSFDAVNKGKASITVMDQRGSVIIQKTVTVSKGINFNILDISRLPAGVYTVKLNQDNEVKVQKMIVE